MTLTDSDFLCDRCGTRWTGVPGVVRCEACGGRLCPECETIRCECGGIYCRRCVHLLEDQGERVLLCEMCHDVASTCEACGNAPADIIIQEAASSHNFRAHLWLCARCCNLRRAAA